MNFNLHVALSADPDYVMVAQSTQEHHSPQSFDIILLAQQSSSGLRKCDTRSYAAFLGGNESVSQSRGEKMFFFQFLKYLKRKSIAPFLCSTTQHIKSNNSDNTTSQHYYIDIHHDPSNRFDSKATRSPLCHGRAWQHNEQHQR